MVLAKRGSRFWREGKGKSWESGREVGRREAREGEEEESDWGACWREMRLAGPQ